MHVLLDDKCGKTRCGIPYNIILNVLKYLSPKKLFFFFFFLSSYSCHSDCNFYKPFRDKDERVCGGSIFYRKRIEPYLMTPVSVSKPGFSSGVRRHKWVRPHGGSSLHEE